MYILLCVCVYKASYYIVLLAIVNYLQPPQTHYAHINLGDEIRDRRRLQRAISVRQSLAETSVHDILLKSIRILLEEKSMSRYSIIRLRRLPDL